MRFSQHTTLLLTATFAATRTFFTALTPAASAAIDDFVICWYGNGDRTDTNLAHLLDIAQKTRLNADLYRAATQGIGG